MTINHSGIYICFEGLDGSGKSTLFLEIIRRLKENKYQFTTICPTKPSENNSFFEILFRKYSFTKKSSLIRAFVYADRSNYACHQTKWDTPLIIGDRSIITSYVTRWRRWFNSRFLSRLIVDSLERCIPAPDHVIYLSAPISLLRKRLLQRGHPLDIDETEERAKQMKNAYHEIQTENCIPRLNKTIWHTIDASKEKEVVADAAWKILKDIIGVK
ncbi:MAG TPA: hypothetical protein DEP42_06280 [Ruminococcaceae bacterium]|jgi:thymidylate kinase|nr:hypothetical protein [Oscillospiraceae bacterium]